MARVKRYELYGEDEEIVSGEYTPIQEREQPRRAAPARKPETAPRNRYFRSSGDDGLGPYTVFDDFERFESKPEAAPRWKEKAPRHYNGGWIATIVICLLILSAAALAVLPQLTGLRYRFLPNLGFMNGSVLVLDEKTEETHRKARETVFTDRIYEGVFIDSVDVSGMTREEAYQAVESANGKVDAAFDLVITVGDRSWHVNNETVPVSRNIRETVDKAWSYGRSNKAKEQGKGKTPFSVRAGELSLHSHPQTYATKQDYDHKALRALTDTIVQEVNRDPVNSRVESFNFPTKTFTFTDDIPGARLDPDDLYTRMTTLLDNGMTYATVPVVPERIEADMTKPELMNRFGLISSYTTTTTKNQNRNTNIRLSAAAINGITVNPGEIFSFNGTTGERTAAKGYKEAAAIAGGQSRDEIGGGVCQTSSTLFNAVARADLEIIERNPHAWPSNYVEKGFDATVNWPGLDFKFRNNTEWPVFIVAAYNDQKVTVNIYGMTLGPGMRIDLESNVVRTIPRPQGTNYVVNTTLKPGESKKTVTGRDGYEVETWKIWYQGDREIKREILHKTTYKAYQETVEYNPQ